MPLIGVLLGQQGYNLSADRLVHQVKNIEKLGYESVWLLDSFSRDPYVTASFILANTTTLKVGTGVATVYSRDALATAQAREALSEYYPGRFLMGLGASNEIVVNLRKGEWIPPLKKMSGYISDLSEAKLASPKPDELAELHLAAHAPKLQDLALEYASGIITWILPVESVSEARKHVGPDLKITANLPCVLSEDPAQARRIARAFLDMYIKLPYYQAAYSKIGFEPEDFENSGSDRLIDAVVAWGSAEAIKARVDEYAAAGASRVVLNLMTGGVNGDSTVGRDWEGLSRLAPLVL